mgnify:FL=1
MTELSTDSVKWFVRTLHEKYDENSQLDDLCNLRFFFEEGLRRGHQAALRDLEEEDEDFNQIGRWTEFPISIIQSNTGVDGIFRDLVRRVTLGERNYLISKFDDEALSGNVGRLQADKLDFKELKEACRTINQSDRLVLPLRDDVREMWRNWRRAGECNLKDADKVVVNGRVHQIRWYSPEKDQNLSGQGYLYDSDSVQVTQKWHGDSVIPENFELQSSFEEYSRNRPFMIHFGSEKTDEDEEIEDLKEKVNLLYRSVLSEPDINSDRMIQLQI